MKIYLPIQNFPKQQEIFDCPARFIVVPKGRRFGATRGSANNFIRMGLTGKFTRGLWVDTVNSNIERYVERYFMPPLMKLGPEGGLWDWRKQQKILRIKNSYIDFRSADNPQNLEGFDYDYGFLNEAGIILRNEYLWLNAIKPMLWDKKCRVIIAGTPKGKGIFHELYLRGQDSAQPDYQSFRFSSFDNPYAPRDLIMKDIENMPQRVVDQEIYAQFLDDSGVVFRGVNNIAVLDPRVTPDARTDHMYVIGCDVAKLVDYTVITVYDRTDNYQVFQMRFNNLEWPVIRMRLLEVSRKYNNALVYLDSTGVGEPLYDDLARVNIPVEPIHLTNELKKQLIEKLSAYIELGHIRMLNLPETITEFNSFTYDISAHGRIMYQAPPGFHDDIVIAHALAIWGLQPPVHRVPVQQMSVIQKDIAIKTGKLDPGLEEDFVDIESWGMYGDN